MDFYNGSYDCYIQSGVIPSVAEAVELHRLVRAADSLEMTNIFVRHTNLIQCRQPSTLIKYV